MRVISKARLRRFWELAGHKDAEGPARAWYTHVNHKATSWNSWADVKAAIATASSVGNCVVFNLGGNKYRLVTRILYVSQKVFVFRMMTHAEYDQDIWKRECGCYDPPPRKTKQHAGKPSKSKRKGN